VIETLTNKFAAGIWAEIDWIHEYGYVTSFDSVVLRSLPWEKPSVGVPVVLSVLGVV
jgi:hypothetical protein